MGGVQKYEDEKETIRKSIEQNVELGLVKRTLQRIIMLRHVGYVSMTTNDLRRLNVFLFSCRTPVLLIEYAREPWRSRRQEELENDQQAMIN